MDTAIVVAEGFKQRAKHAVRSTFDLSDLSPHESDKKVLSLSWGGFSDVSIERDTATVSRKHFYRSYTANVT